MPTDIEYLKQLYDSGYSLQECCYACGLKSPGSLLKRFRNHQIQTRSLTESVEKYKLSLPMERIIKMYECGLSCQDIALQFNCSRSSINKYLHKYGVRLRDRSDAAGRASGSLLNQETKELILKLRSRYSLPARVISERTGINQAVVKNILCKRTT